MSFATFVIIVGNKCVAVVKSAGTTVTTQSHRYINYNRSILLYCSSPSIIDVQMSDTCIVQYLHSTVVLQVHSNNTIFSGYHLVQRYNPYTYPCSV